MSLATTGQEGTLTRLKRSPFPFPSELASKAESKVISFGKERGTKEPYHIPSVFVLFLCISQSVKVEMVTEKKRKNRALTTPFPFSPSDSL